MKDFILKRKKLFMIIGLSVLGIAILTLVLTSKPIANKIKMYKFKNTVEKVIQKSELYYLEQGNSKDLTILLPDLEGILNLKDKGLNGRIVLTKGGNASLAIYNSTFCAIKSVDEDKITINFDAENCIMPRTVITDPNSNLSSENECVKYHETCTNGTAVALKVNENDTHNFYVINDTGSVLTLILNKNLGPNISWITMDDYTASGGTNYGNFGNNEKGPVTVINELKTLTDNWTNVAEQEYVISGIGNDNKTVIYKDIVMNMKARILTFEEAKKLGCSMEGASCPEYLYSNLSGLNTSILPSGYWTSTGNVSSSNNAWYINYSGNIYNNAYLSLDSGRGIRPVITIEK